jgi:hypothetical protein
MTAAFKGCKWRVASVSDIRGEEKAQEVLVVWAGEEEAGVPTWVKLKAFGRFSNQARRVATRAALDREDERQR